MYNAPPRSRSYIPSPKNKVIDETPAAQEMVVVKYREAHRPNVAYQSIDISNPLRPLIQLAVPEE